MIQWPGGTPLAAITWLWIMWICVTLLVSYIAVEEILPTLLCIALLRSCTHFNHLNSGVWMGQCNTLICWFPCGSLSCSMSPFGLRFRCHIWLYNTLVKRGVQTAGCPAPLAAKQAQIVVFFNWTFEHLTC